VHNLVWTVQKTDVTVDKNARYVERETIFMWPEDVVIHKEPLNYFYLLFPVGYVNEIVAATSYQLQYNNRGAPINNVEFYKYLGIRLSMSVTRVNGGIEAYWNNINDNNSTILSPNYGQRFGMSYNRFKAITDCLCLCSMNNINMDVSCISPILSLFDIYFIL